MPPNSSEFHGFVWYVWQAMLQYSAFSAILKLPLVQFKKNFDRFSIECFVPVAKHVMWLPNKKLNGPSDTQS